MIIHAFLSILLVPLSDQTPNYSIKQTFICIDNHTWVIVQYHYLTLKIDETRLIRRVFTRNKMIWQIKSSLCPAK